MRLIDKFLFAESRMLRDLLRLRGIRVGRRHIGTLMRKIGIRVLYTKPNTSAKHPSHRIYPYLLCHISIDRPNQVWAMDISYIPMAGGFIYLAVVIGWYTGDLQFQSGQSGHFSGLYRSTESQRYPHRANAREIGLCFLLN